MREIMLDIDNKNISTSLVNKWDWIIYFLGLDVVDVTVNKSTSGNNHVTFTVLNNINDYEHVFIQLAMGSDLKRECFNLLRIHSGKFKNQSWNVLFKNKWEYKL